MGIAGTPSAVVELADDSKLPDDVRKRIGVLRDRMGFLPNSMGLYMHRPPVAGAVLDLISAIGHHETSTLERSLKRKLALICSAANGCVYCTSHQCNFLSSPRGLDIEGWEVAPEEIANLMSGNPKSTDPFEQACFDFAIAASRDPSKIPDKVYDDVKSQLDDDQIVELASVVGMWKMLNTIHDSLKISVEEAVEEAVI